MKDPMRRKQRKVQAVRNHASTTHGIVSIASLDIRRRPDHRAELASQLLLGEIVRLGKLSPDGLWREIENLADGYRGWARRWGLEEGSRVMASRWRARARARIAALFVEARERPGAGALVSPLVWNARVIAGAKRGSHRAVTLPDGRRGWVPSSALAPGRTPDLRGRVRDLLGIPYLWGGRTPLGFDCSGFTQQLLSEQGIPIARDADQQHRDAAPLPPGERPRLGDLVFFGRLGRPMGHVGIGLGGGRYAHCRRVVRISSTDPQDPLFDAELAPTVRGWRRPRGRAPRG
jgi:cell wall-associated NlpC family hydrolase